MGNERGSFARFSEDDDEDAGFRVEERAKALLSEEGARASEAMQNARSVRMTLGGDDMLGKRSRDRRCRQSIDEVICRENEEGPHCTQWGE
jgi:hypothetical protein